MTTRQATAPKVPLKNSHAPDTSAQRQTMSREVAKITDAVRDLAPIRQRHRHDLNLLRDVRRKMSYGKDHAAMDTMRQSLGKAEDCIAGEWHEFERQYEEAMHEAEAMKRHLLGLAQTKRLARDQVSSRPPGAENEDDSEQTRHQFDADVTFYGDQVQILDNATHR